MGSLFLYTEPNHHRDTGDTENSKTDATIHSFTRNTTLATGVPCGRMCVHPVTLRNVCVAFHLRISSSEITRSCYQVSLPGSLYCAAHLPVLADLLAFPEVQ